MGKRKKKVIVFSLVILIFWITGVIPKNIGKMVSSFYVHNKYSSLNLHFVDIKYSEENKVYISHFENNEGKIYTVLVGSKMLPVNVSFNPLNIPKRLNLK